MHAHVQKLYCPGLGVFLDIHGELCVLPWTHSAKSLRSLTSIMSRFRSSAAKFIREIYVTVPI